MLIDFIETRILSEFGFSPTEDQKKLIRVLAGFMNSSTEVLIISGYAGTGKTSLLAAFTRVITEMKIPLQLLAPTGRAAKVFSLYAHLPASTIHKCIYRQASVSGVEQRFSLQYNTRSNALFLIDEASMLANSNQDTSLFGSGRLLDDVFDFVFSTQKQCKIIFIGDNAQLPPIGLSQSPALVEQHIAESYLKHVQQIELTEVVRQEKNSGILDLATRIRNSLRISKYVFPKILSSHDVVPLTGDMLLERLEHSYDTVGLENTIVITRSNKMANKYNLGIRSAILWRDERIAKGDYIMIVKNNYFWSEQSKKIDFIANGDIAEIVSVSKYEELYDFSFVNVCLRFPDYDNEELQVKLLLNTLESESPSLPYEQNQRFFSAIQEDYMHIGNKRTRYKEMQKNEYFNALQIKFSYAVTCHKAQGGQWKHVYIDHGYMPQTDIDEDFLRWLYTACTRATEIVYPVNFKKEFFS